MFYKKHIRKSSKKGLSVKLDRIFSEYIRRRDCKGGYGYCITCGAIITYDTSDCGHFQNRDRKIVRWDEQNANAQCRKCNRFQSGRQYEHGKAIDKKFGYGTADRLATLANVAYFKVNDIWLQKKIEYYKNKLLKYENNHN